MTYEPQEDSYMLLEQVKQLAFGKVLDVGTGSGILAKEAVYSHEVEEVVAVDIDENVVEELNKQDVKGLKVFQSDLFANITEKFDTIIFNPPYLPLDENDKDAALDGGVKGYEVIEMFLKEAKKHLRTGGMILMVFSNRTGKKEVDSIIKREGYKAKELERKNIAFFEELYVYKIERERLASPYA
ncbi:MAG: methyltransferase [Nanoarchaeota archaeon]|nr:methyltransferase [Nanoarchaeota archaeon]MBU1321644.1 methyltransferase [Nanoarchaeota archaeon]MBU1597146.1 methyltransferase [Nanoarchaeota archaeon]MBU2442079.1 methyltransferase [Nanoarchaeota archaeon]